MFGLNFNKKTILGIDIGTAALKVVELEINDGKPPHLLNYAWMLIPEIIKEDKDSEKSFFETNVPEFLKKLMTEARFNSKDAFVSISAFGGLVTLIELPEMRAEDLEQAVRFEAHKYIPTSLDDVAISWEVINGEDLAKDKNFLIKKNAEGVVTDSAPKKIQVLLVAAFKNKIAAYEKAVKAAGLNLKGLNFNTF